MRSRAEPTLLVCREARRTTRAAALMLAAAGVVASAAGAPVADLPDPATVAHVVAAMASAPAAPARHKEHVLRFKPDPDATPQKPTATPAWLQALARWLAGAGNGLVWLLGAIGVALLIVFAWRWAAVRGETRRPRALVLPSHVKDLDIRPESLPDDVAGAARALCRAGDRHGALSLLYRGALSRLVHDHHAPILASSTEGECARIAARVLPNEAAAYVGALVQAWQVEVYAGRDVDAECIEALCAGFDAHFRPRLPAAVSMPEAAA